MYLRVMIVKLADMGIPRYRGSQPFYRYGEWLQEKLDFPLYVGRGMMTAVYSDDLVARRLVAGQIRYIERIWVRVPAGGDFTL